MNSLELLAPAGSAEKLETALRFGADAVYFGGPGFGLRAQATFDEDGVASAIRSAHALGKRAYVTVNIFARNADFALMEEYLAQLQSYGADGVIVSDPGVMALCRKLFPNLSLHISTQANTLNRYAAEFYAELGAKRIVLARELSIREIGEIRDYLSPAVELEAFVHGAMCISYSGRCLLSNYLADRESNRGECVQACRWNYAIREFSRGQDGELEIEEDARGTYILNSKDLCMIAHLRELISAGVTSFKIEGRAKTAYYVATIANAYRRALDLAMNNQPATGELIREVEKASNRRFTTGFYFNAENTIELRSSAPSQDFDICAVVLEDARDGEVWVEMRNRFWKGLRVEILSPGELWTQSFTLETIHDADGAVIEDVKRVQARVRIATDLPLKKGDILRRDAKSVKPET